MSLPREPPRPVPGLAPRLVAALLLVLGAEAAALGAIDGIRALAAALALLAGWGVHRLWGPRLAPAAVAGWYWTAAALSLVFLVLPAPWRPLPALLAAGIASASDAPRAPELMIVGGAAAIAWQGPAAWSAAGEAGVAWSATAMALFAAAAIVERDRLVAPVQGKVAPALTTVRLVVLALLTTAGVLVIQGDMLTGAAAWAGGGLGGRLLLLGIVLIGLVGALIVARRP